MHDIVNKFMDRCIVLHDFYDKEPIVVRIDKIEAMYRDIREGNESCVICLHSNQLFVLEPMGKVLEILQRRG